MARVRVKLVVRVKVVVRMKVVVRVGVVGVWLGGNKVVMGSGESEG